MNTFEIWMADVAVFIGGRIEAGPRPVVVVASEPGREDDKMVTIAPCTTDLCSRQRATHVLLQGQGLEKECRVLCECVTTVDKRLFLWQIGEVTDPYDRYAIRHGLSVHLALPGEWEWI